MEVAQGYTIACRGLENGRHEFRFEVGKPLFEAFGSPEIKDGRCDVEVVVERSEALLEAAVRIGGYVVVPCDRCLEECRIPIDFAGRVPIRYDEVPHEYDGETLWLLPGEDEVDLAQYVYESIVLSLPYQRVHPEGECDAEMLSRFRIVSDEEFSAIERRASDHGVPESERAKLEELRRMLEAGEADPQEGEKETK